MLEHSIDIPKYDGNLQLINKLTRLIESKYSEIFYAVIVHGSIATNEVIKYSDFDGLLIVKGEFINSRQLASFKKESMKVILKFDPLQHHGWFQILESQLYDYPQRYLPYEVLEYSKLIYPNVERLVLNLEIDENKVDYKNSLKQLISSIELQSKTDIPEMRLYDLKSFLSKIMLLPSMYYSVKYNKGIFKKESFDAVKHHFTDHEWDCIRISSQIRENWNQDLRKFQLFLLKISPPLLRKIILKHGLPKISSKTSNLFDKEYYSSLNKLIKKIQKELI